MKTTPSSGTWASTSPRVWAGPTSSSSTRLSPTVQVSVPSKVRVGGVGSMPEKSKAPKACCMKRLTGLSWPASALIMSASRPGGNSSISSAQAREAMISAPFTSWLP